MAFNWFRKPEPKPKNGNGYQKRQEIIDSLRRQEEQIDREAQRAGVSVSADSGDEARQRGSDHPA